MKRKLLGLFAASLVPFGCHAGTSVSRVPPEYNATRLQEADRICSKAFLEYERAVFNDSDEFAVEVDRSRLDSAIQATDECLEKNPYQGWVLARRALLHALIGNPEEASADAKNALEQLPGTEMERFIGIVWLRNQLVKPAKLLAAQHKESGIESFELEEEIHGFECHEAKRRIHSAQLDRLKEEADECTATKEREERLNCTHDFAGGVSEWAEFYWASEAESGILNPMWNEDAAVGHVTTTETGEVLDCSTSGSRYYGRKISFLLSEGLESVEKSLPRMKCGKLSAPYIDALGQALGLPEPKRQEMPSFVVEQMRRAMEEMGVTNWEPPEAQRGSHLTDMGGFDCFARYQVSPDVVMKLAEVDDFDALGRAWAEAARYVNPMGESWEKEPVGADGVLQDSNGDPIVTSAEEWGQIAKDLSAFIRARGCEQRQLYLDVSYDC